MKIRLSRMLTLSATLLACGFFLVSTASATVAQNPSGVTAMHGPTFPPDPWENLTSFHGPTFPPDPWENLTSFHGPTFPPDPWEN